MQRFMITTACYTIALSLLIIQEARNMGILGHTLMAKCLFLTALPTVRTLAVNAAHYEIKDQKR